MLKRDPFHPSLHFKKVGRFWSIRVGIYYRAIAVEKETDIVWFWIGRHDEYERLIRKAGKKYKDNKSIKQISFHSTAHVHGYFY